MTRTSATMASLSAAALMLSASPALAQTMPTGMGMRHAPGIMGTVSSVSGSTLTVQSRGRGPNTATSTSTLTYSVDASNATVIKGNATSSLSAIATGDMVMVQGTVSGNSVTATQIRDGVPAMGSRGKWQGKPGGPRPNFPEIQGNGQPVIGGSVSAINGSSITLSTKAGASYTVDGSGATVIKGNATSSLGNLAVGDNVVVQGSVNGSAVTASSIIAGNAPQNATVSSTGAPHGIGLGFLGGIGGFLHNLFGFF